MICIYDVIAEFFLVGVMLLHYNFHRYYDPETGRYLSLDPLRDGVNWYEYAGGNPINYYNPYGLNWSALGYAGMIVTTIGAGVVVAGTAPVLGPVLLFGGLAVTAYDTYKGFKDAFKTGEKLAKPIDDYYRDQEENIDEILNGGGSRNGNCP